MPNKVVIDVIRCENYFPLLDYNILPHKEITRPQSNDNYISEY